ncbi:MAG: lectin MOA-related protein [Rhodobacteraceae bacterium]|nr:lectin MOA-related protein [Paracoccaceae bacterium]
MAKQVTKPVLETTFRNQFDSTDPHMKALVLASDTTFEMPSKTLFDEAYGFAKDAMPHGDTFSKVDFFDCDDFSYIFKGLISKWYQENRPHDLPLAIGISWGLFPGFGNNEIHSMNWVIFDSGELHWIEPQFVNGKAMHEAMRASDTSRDKLNFVLI